MALASLPRPLRLQALYNSSRGYRGILAIALLLPRPLRILALDIRVELRRPFRAIVGVIVILANRPVGGLLLGCEEGVSLGLVSTGFFLVAAALLLDGDVLDGRIFLLNPLLEHRFSLVPLVTSRLSLRSLLGGGASRGAEVGGVGLFDLRLSYFLSDVRADVQVELGSLLGLRLLYALVHYLNLLLILGAVASL